MMNVLFLQSPYSFLFRDIAKKLNSIGSECTAVTFNLGDKYIFKGIKQVDVHKKLKKSIKISNFSESELNVVDNIDTFYSKQKYKIYNEKISQYEKKYFASYIRFIENYIIENEIKIIVMQNDTRWQHQLAIHVAKKLNIKYFVFELGLFRPNSITIDPNGVNYNNSVPRNKNYYLDSRKYNYFNLETVKSDISEFKRNVILIKYLIYYKIGEILNLNSIPNKEIKLSEYIKRFLKAYTNKKQNEFILPKDIKYIFVPLQVSNDSQTLVHSNFKNMIEFMEIVIDGVKKYNKSNELNLKIIFKEHPMDIGKVDYSEFYSKYSTDEDIIFTKYGSTEKLIENSEVVVTINSTVGLEALEKNKKVITLGRAFYSIDGICENATESNLNLVIEKVLHEDLDIVLLNNFIEYLKYNYSVEGNEYYYNDDTINRISEIIINSR